MIADIDQNASAPGPLQELMAHLEAADQHLQWLRNRTLFMGETSLRLDRALKEISAVAHCAGQLRVEMVKGGGQ